MILNAQQPFQAIGHAKAQEMTLVGYYQASERLDDTALAPVGERVAQRIRDQFNDAVAFVVSRGIMHGWEIIEYSFQD